MIPVYALFALLAATAAALFLAVRSARLAAQAAAPRGAAGAPRSPFSSVLRRVSELAGPSLSESELAAVWAAAALIPAVAGVMLGLGVMSLALSAAGAAAVPAWAAMGARARNRRFEEDLGQVMPLIASNLRAGSSIAAAIAPVAESMDDPIRGEFSRLAADVRSGTPLPDAIDAMAGRNDSKDLRLYAIAVRISMQRGGSLADITERVGETVRARGEMRRFIRAKTSANRFEAYFLSAMPVVILAAMVAMSPIHREFYATPAGIALLAACALFDLLGLAIMSKMGDLETD